MNNISKPPTGQIRAILPVCCIGRAGIGRFQSRTIERGSIQTYFSYDLAIILLVKDHVSLELQKADLSGELEPAISNAHTGHSLHIALCRAPAGLGTSNGNSN